MFELKTALSYLIPRRKQLSVSVVGLIAIGVIQAIVWLILVFFSTTEGIEQEWSRKITSVLGSMQVIPSNGYCDSPFCQIDLYSHQSNNSSLRISEKALQETLPYDSTFDPPLTESLETWYNKNPKNGLSLFLQDLTRAKIPYRFFESTICHLNFPALGGSPNGGTSFYSYLFGLDHLDKETFSAAAEIESGEVEKLLDLLSTETESSEALTQLALSIDKMELIGMEELEQNGNSLPKGSRFNATFSASNKLLLETASGSTITFPLTAKKRPFSILKVTFRTQPTALGQNLELSYHPKLGYPILLPKQQRQMGIRLFDTGSFEFLSQTSPMSAPLKIPFFVAGFFDSGILPIGGRLCLTSKQAVLAIEPNLHMANPLASSGIIIDTPIDNIIFAQPILQNLLEKRIPDLFSLQPYNQYDATKDLYQQLTSEKTLFRLISCIIVCVACSNIFSMLFILAHDRRKEIAILRALGTSKSRITAIFFISGLLIGLAGAILGSLLAALTLYYLPELLSYLGAIQGQVLLKESIYGTIGPQTIKLTPLLFSFTTVSFVSGIAGLLAAIRACRTNISEALRS